MQSIMKAVVNVKSSSFVANFEVYIVNEAGKKVEKEKGGVAY